MVDSVNIIVSYLFIIVIILFWWLFFISIERKDKKIRIIEKPIYGRDLRKESKHREKRYCTDFCTKNICNEYKTVLSYFDQCKKCSDINMCWNLDDTNCHICESGESTVCESDKNYGCWNEELNKYTAPINPKLTACNPCWKYKENVL